MKKIILASLLMVSVSTAFAQAASTACSSGTASTHTLARPTTRCISVPAFKPVCSANSIVRFTDSVAAQKLTAGSASVKGASYFGGSTQGGAIQRAGACVPINGLRGCCGSKHKLTVGMTAADAYGASS
jgi:hypothetical protein